LKIEGSKHNLVIGLERRAGKHPTADSNTFPWSDRHKISLPGNKKACMGDMQAYRTKAHKSQGFS